MAKLTEIEGIGGWFALLLEAAGVRSSDSLLSKGATAKGRREIARRAGISEAKILEWVNHADLFRIKGVGEEYADLLEASGVDTVPELAKRNARNLHAKICEVNREKHLVRRLPSKAQVIDWCKQAGRLPRVISHGAWR